MTILKAQNSMARDTSIIVLRQLLHRLATGRFVASGFLNNGSKSGYLVIMKTGAGLRDITRLESFLAIMWSAESGLRMTVPVLQ